MLMKSNFEHYPLLKRRKRYRTKNNGEYYGYANYKDEIAEDSQDRCVYCDARGSELGGREMMQLDHFRPQKTFPDLINNPFNLVLSCSRCNLLKRHDWTVPQNNDVLTYVDGVGYIDPFETDRLQFFVVESNGRLSSKQPPAQYIIDKLALNRRFLQLNRIKRNLLFQYITGFEKKLKLLDSRIASCTDDKEKQALEDHKDTLEKALEAFAMVGLQHQ